jgi:excisionase family DNA binding protein
MLQAHYEQDTTKPTVLSGWLTRGELAAELGVSVDTLGRWEARRSGPPCVRAGRKVLYRRQAVQDWLRKKEEPAPKKRGRK